ncbi:MAG TPA: hypothetical protein VJ506_04060, partial [Candidatus Limnocylindrales bacterium]|nr:hypothetical protein [Candidatus Limnocylindrales bacterium]
MPPTRLVAPTRRAFALALAVGVGLGCSATSAPQPTPGASVPLTPDPSPAPLVIHTSPPVGSANPAPAALPPHEVMTGPNV